MFPIIANDIAESLLDIEAMSSADGIVVDSTPLFSRYRNASQRQRRKRARRGDKMRKRMIVPFTSWTSIPRGMTYKKIQQQRLDKKNERRAVHGLPPLESYSQV